VTDRPRPSAEESLLLQAALAEPSDAVAAWRAYCGTSGGIDAVEGDGFDLLPQVYRNLGAAAYAGADAGRLKGVYRQSWYANRVALHAAAGAVTALGAPGPPIVLLNRAAIVAVHPELVGALPMDTVDLLLPRQTDVDAALAALDRAGWERPSHPHRDSRDARHLEHRDGGRITLRSQGLVHAHGYEKRLAEHARAAAFGRATVLVPDPTDLFLLACARALGAPQNRLRWIVDATLLARSGDVRFAELASRARQAAATLGVRAALTYLNSDLGLDVPAETLADLQLARVGPAEHLRRRIALDGGRSPLWHAIRRTRGAVRRRARS
jgi:Uncharacterised nucleotidyltransferase